MESRKLGNIYGFDGGNYAGNVFDKEALAPTLLNMQGGNRQPMIVEDVVIGGMQKNQAIKNDGVCTCLTSAMGEGGGYTPMVVEEKNGLNTETDGTCRTIKAQYAKTSVANFERSSTFGATGVIVAMRGRNPENPTSRVAGLPTEQRLEPNSQGICNTLTSVQKDNMVLESKERYRIRKLTPRECWRLMAFSDEDFEKAEAVNSNTQLYKEAGNSIIVTVLEAIFRQMHIQDIPTWEEVG